MNPLSDRTDADSNRTDADKVQFSIRHLIQLTVVFGVVFAIAKAIGVSGSLAVAVCACLFAPTIAWGASKYARKSWRSRVILWSPIAIALVSCSVFTFAADSVAAIALLLGSFCCWLPQYFFLSALHSMWKSGLRSAGVDPAWRTKR